MESEGRQGGSRPGASEGRRGRSQLGEVHPCSEGGWERRHVTTVHVPLRDPAAVNFLMTSVRSPDAQPLLPSIC
jgi:hypothetical protein